MADLEDVTLDGRPLQSLRVADLKAALEERGLSKSGQKNALIKRLKGALMLENLQRTSTAQIGLQPNSQIGEEMSQNSFIKQYLAKQQELLRQRLEREAREAYESSDQEDHNEVNNSTCPSQAQDVSPAVTDHYKPPGPSSGPALPEGLSNRNQEPAMSHPPASGSATQDRGPNPSEAAADSDEDESEDGEEDADDDDDWDNSIQRRIPREPVRAPMARERSAASCQPQQQHIPSLLSPQLRQPTPPPSPPPELSFPLPDTPKQSPPSPDVAPAGRSPSSSSSGSSSSGSRSSSPEPHSGNAERKPGPLTLLARKMESEGAFSGAGWHGRDGNRQDNGSSSITFPGRVHPEGLVSAIPSTLVTAGHAPMNQAHAQVPVSVLKAAAERDAELQKEKALELERQEQQRKQAVEGVWVKAALEREEKQKTLEKERFEREQALEREKALLALEKERQEKELALAREREEQERALELEQQKELERQKALEKERAVQREREEHEQRERAERERVMELERAKALEREREEKVRALKLERERALEAERMERERIARKKALEQERVEKERLERERLEREATLEKERKERERALEQERLEQEKALEQERLERERIEREKVLEQERLKREKALELERIEREKALELERLEQERITQEKALELKRLEQERIKQEKALELERLEQERIKQEKVLELERLEQERIKQEKALEQERVKQENALERERVEREKALELEQMERERALEQQRLELEKRKKERMEREKAIEQERKEKAERVAALENEQLEKERAEQERKEQLEREKAQEQERKEKEKTLERGNQKLVEHEKLEKEKVAQEENTANERASSDKKEKSRMAELESEPHLPASKRGCEIGFIPLPTPPPLSTGPTRKASPEAGKQEGEVHAPVSRNEGQAEESDTPKTPQSSFKKFRFLRDTPLQPQASSMVIKRPRTFSHSPQPCVSSVMTAISVKGQQHKGQSADLEDVAGQLRSEGKSVDALESDNKEGATTLVSKDKGESAKSEASAKESIREAADMCPSSPVAITPLRERDAKKTEKKDTRRSSSNDSSSESDSGSSSRSSDTSMSSQGKTHSSRQRRDECPEKVASPQEVSKEHQKTSPSKMEISRKANSNEDVLTTNWVNEAPPRDSVQRRISSKDGEEKLEKQRQVKETAMSKPEKGPEANEETPKAFSARKISLSSSKSSPSAGSTENDHESGSASGRKRRWGSSTAVTAKKPSISITTDSLKSLIPDIRPCLSQETVVDLNPEEPVLSETEDEEKEHTKHDQELQIRRTVTQVVNLENQENGQQEAKQRREELEDDDMQGERETKTQEENTYPQALETPSPPHTRHEAEMNTVTPSDTLIRRSISQQKTGVSITIDDPVRTARLPSPPRGNVSNIVHVCNLVRPFTLGQLKELLGRTGTLVEDGFWIDKIKSHCYVTYSSSEEAVATRAALHGVKWPQSNPKVLSVDFCQQDELDFHKGLGSADRPGAEEQGHGRGLPSLVPERDQWAEREREMERREKARAEREWDRDKVREFGKTGEEREGGPRRSRSRERRRKDRGKSKEKKPEKKEKAAEDPPAKLLDDLFRKTKAAPCIYWLPLTEEQFLQREADRAERRKEREKQRKKEEEEEELKKKEEVPKEKMKAGGGVTGDRSEGEKDKDRNRGRGRDRDRGRDRERETDKHRDGYRRPGGNAATSGRRSRSRSDPRERRR